MTMRHNRDAIMRAEGESMKQAPEVLLAVNEFHEFVVIDLAGLMMSLNKDDIETTSDALDDASIDTLDPENSAQIAKVRQFILDGDARKYWGLD